MLQVGTTEEVQIILVRFELAPIKFLDLLVPNVNDYSRKIDNAAFSYILFSGCITLNCDPYEQFRVAQRSHC
jgi:hypothetical protein